ncbi:MAG: small multi-drug export protein [Thermoplasmatales archaeon]|nr:small multi-drug export protein [Thermoplasmatales archaeon]
MMYQNPRSKLLLRLGKFFLPFILGFGVFTILWLIISEEVWTDLWPLIPTYFFPPLGKESIIPLGIGFGIHPILIALSIAFVDIVVALFLVWNYDLAKKVPFVGKFMIKVEEKGKNVEQKYGWIKPLRFIGIVLFVMVPFQGSGGLVGSIVGRLIGMKPWVTFFAISLGAIIGCLLIATFAQAFLIFAEINTTLTIILIAIIVLIIILYFIIKRRKNKSN